MKKLRKAREARGEGDVYKEIQPVVRPELEELVGELIDVLYPFFVATEGREQETVTRWYQ